jgi:hypothetical protein
MSDSPAVPDGEKRPMNDPDMNRIFDALRHRYRRHILWAVAEDNPRDEAEFTPEELHLDDDLAMFERQLFHVHLPKLAESGYIEWDRETSTIRRGEDYDEVAPVIRVLKDHEDELPADWV